MDRREHHRVQLRIPARLRWTTPLGQTTEICETLNVSRGGLLVPCKENHATAMPLWVTFPFDATLPFGQPEVLARVVRSELVAARVAAGSGNGDATHTQSGPPGMVASAGHFGHYQDLAGTAMVFVASAAVQFETKSHPKNDRKNGNGNGHGSGHRREIERRTSERQMVAVPIRVRLEHVPWFEETMTMDACIHGLRFVSCREYEPGQHLMVSFEDAVLSPWPVAAEFRSLVVRVDRLPQGAALAVTIYRLP
jgi:hypothetical protein